MAARVPVTPARPISSCSAAPARARPTGVGELDRVLGGGLVPGAVGLLAGGPGVGKSTLLLDVAQRWASGGGADAGPALVISAEESVSQVRLRAERIGALDERLFVAAETDLAAVLGHLDTVKPGLLVLDSVQTVSAPGVDGVPGGVTQVRAVTVALTGLAKERGLHVIHRSQALHWLIGGRRLVSVAGAHGKTTSTGMIVTAQDLLLRRPEPTRDEIREIQPGMYLGKVYWDDNRLIDFLLEFGRKS